jgi:hypothetical protein
MRPRIVVIRSLAFAALLGTVACASMHVQTYVPRGANVRQYHTYAWAPAGAFETGDPRLDNNTLFIERLQSAVERQLARKGWAPVQAKEADVVVHFHARVDQRLDLAEKPGSGRPAEDSRGGPQVYDAGTLLLDFVEARSNTLLWRGWAEGSVDGVIDNQAWMNERIDAAVERILAAFP